MHLEGACHCRRVRFSVETPHPYPFSLCYCSICRKTAGGAAMPSTRAPGPIAWRSKAGSTCVSVTP